MKNLVTAAFVLSMLGLGASSKVMAQSTGADGAAVDDSNVVIIMEILVTARRREEALQEVPLSISAFTEQDIAMQNIQGVTDIALQTPGLNYEGYVSAGQVGAPVMRGLTPTDLTNREQNVATFLDGIYLPNQAMIDLGVLDLSRVEVVRGPQNALYGRNAFAGAINYVTRTPDDQLRASIKGTFGSDERRDLTLSASGPIVPGVLYGKASYGATEFDGTWFNNHPNADVNISPGTKENAGGWDNEALSLGLVLDVERWEAGVTYYRTEVGREVLPHYNLLGVRAQAFGITRFNDLNCNTSAPFGPFGPSGYSLFCGKMPTLPTPIPGDPLLEGLQMDPRSFGLQAENELITAKVRYEFGNFAVNYLLGRVDFSGYGGSIVDRDQVLGSDIRGFLPPAVRPPFPLLSNQVDARPVSDTESRSHELRIESLGSDRLQWLAGVFYYEVEDDRRVLNSFATPLSTDSIGEEVRNATAGNSFFEDEAFAVFGSVEYWFSDQWAARVEARYTKEDKEITRLTGVFGPVLVPNQEEDFSFFTPRISINWRFAEDRLLYASAAKGVKAGGFNTAVNPAQYAYDQEENWTYEVGAKTTWLDDRLQLNGTLFLVDWTDLQITEAQYGPGVTTMSPTVIGNAGGAESKGFEIYMAYLVTENLQASLGYALADPKFDDGVINLAAARNVLCDGTVCSPDHDIGGNSLERQSKNQVTFNLDYRQPLAMSPNLDLFGNFNLSHQSKQYLSSLNVGHTGSRTVANAQLGVGGDNWELSLWCRNCFDEKYVSSSFFISFANAYAAALGERRTWGLSVRLKIGDD